MGKRKNRRWSWEEKRRIVGRMEEEGHQDLADELGVDRRQLYAWRKQVRREVEGPPGDGPVERLEKEVRQLRDSLARKGDGSGFLAGCVAKNRGSTPEQRKHWCHCIYQEIGEVEQEQQHPKIQWTCR